MSNSNKKAGKAGSLKDKNPIKPKFYYLSLKLLIKFE